MYAASVLMWWRVQYCDRLNVVRFWHAHRNDGCTTRAMDWAAANGHVENDPVVNQVPLGILARYPVNSFS